jgi:CHAT domain-containing protein
MAILAQYFCGRDEGHLFIADARGGDPHITHFPLHAVYEAIRDYFKRLIGTGESGTGENQAGDALRSLVQPIVEHSVENEVVWIVPHDILHYLPFHAIPTTEGFLGFRNPVCYTPSASALSVCRRGPRLDGKAVITLGDPTRDLAYARREAESVTEAFHGELLLGGKATKEALFAALGKHDAVDILHLACHGRAGAKDPLLAGVLLAPDRANEDSGGELLTAGEMLRRKLRAGLVTVSACDAGFGAVEASDEVLGLTRALLYAGAASVLLSYWPLDDLSTYLTIERFYEELQPMIGEGAGNKATAVRAAQRHIHDMTVRDVIARCDAGAERCAARSDVRGQLEFLDEAAEWVTTAGDFEDAIRRHRLIRTLVDASPSAFPGRGDLIQDRIEELEFRSMLRREPVDYDGRPFSDEKHWAGFFLHGDWRL